MLGVTGLQKACVMHPAPGSGGVDGVWGGAGTQELYNRALAIKSAIPHPRIMAIIRECGGKMHMHDRAWSSAATAFFEVLPPPPKPFHTRYTRVISSHRCAHCERVRAGTDVVS